MGTNYFVIIKPPKDVQDYFKNRVLSQLEICNYNEAIRQLTDMTKLAGYDNNKVHIGKRSNGWKFRFNHNNLQYYNLTRESISNFIAENYLIDEYGARIDPDHFWELVDINYDLQDNESYCETTATPPEDLNVSKYYDEFHNLEGLVFQEETQFF